MIEFIRHALGLCGEHSHPSLLSLIATGGFFGTTFIYVSGIIKNLFK